MKVIVIKSDHSEVPLAEVRTDGRVLDFVVDNTNGRLPKLFQNSYQHMQRIVSNSSHMTMEIPQKATVNLLRYVLDNGDVAEITSDGHTVLLNGTLLTPDEKDALFAAVKRGEIKVVRKTDVQQAIPIVNPPQEQQQQKLPQVKISASMMNMIQEDQKKASKAQEMASKKYDQQIEEAKLHQAEDKEWTRRLMYWLKYGDQ